MVAKVNRNDNVVRLIALASFLVSIIGTYASWSTASQAVSAAERAASIAKSAYEIANNYPPSVEIRSTTRLMLYPDLSRKASFSTNVSCPFTGRFNVSFTIIAPHVGNYNISILAFNGPVSFSPHPVEFFYSQDGELIKIGNVTISTSPLPQPVSPCRGGVPAAQPFDQTVEVRVSGFTLTIPLGSTGEQHFNGFGTLTAILTYSDIQTGKDVQRPFIVQVEFADQSGLVPPF